MPRSPRRPLRIINSAFGCAGQRCMALPVVVVEESIADELVGQIVALASKLKMGPAWDPSTELGPLVSPEQKKSVLNWIDCGVKEGAKLVLDGRNAKVAGCENGFFVGPTIFDHVGPAMRIGIDEIFGPGAVHQAGQELRGRRRHHQRAASSPTGRRSSRSMATTPASSPGGSMPGMVGVNVGIPVPISAFPFCGHKASFFGDLHCMGTDGVAFYTETKAVTSHWFSEAEMKQTRVGTWEGTISRT